MVPGEKKKKQYGGSPREKLDGLNLPLFAAEVLWLAVENHASPLLSEWELLASRLVDM